MKIKVGGMDKRSEGSSAEQRAQRDAEEQQKSGTVGGTEFSSAPHDFRRTDMELLQDVRDAFSSRAGLVPEQIDVSVDEGVVTLEGIVTTEEVRQEAELIAQRVMDVQGVQNRMQVLRPD